MVKLHKQQKLHSKKVQNSSEIIRIFVMNENDKCVQKFVRNVLKKIGFPLDHLIMGLQN